MKLEILLPVLLVMALLRWRRAGMLAWVFAWVAGGFVVLRYGFTTPIPWSVVQLYMGILCGSLIAYVFSDRKRMRQVLDPLVAFAVERRFLPYLVIVGLAIPVLAAFKIYLDMTAPPAPPVFGRTVHPAPPAEIEVHGKSFDLIHLDNPYRSLERSDPDAFHQHVDAGRRVYYSNCFFCHGDLMRGGGMYAHGLNPIPTNFQDAGTIAQLQESFLFWRISKGGPGLPEEGGPWASAMPVWESFLSEEEIWDVILFLYDYTGWRPRARGGESE